MFARDFRLIEKTVNDLFDLSLLLMPCLMRRRSRRRARLAVH
jgi:hypothetical protein